MLYVIIKEAILKAYSNSLTSKYIIKFTENVTYIYETIYETNIDNFIIVW